MQQADASGSEMDRIITKKSDTRLALLEAAKKVLRKNGFSGLSTRAVALAAKMPLSQIHYHFGSREGLLLALFEYLNAQLLHRQDAMFSNPALKLSAQWDMACAYLDEDLASGYVRVLQELWAAGYSNPEIAKVVRDGIRGWHVLITRVARQAEKSFGPLPGLTPEEISALVGTAFIGTEAYVLLALEDKRIPVRAALRKVGALIEKLEQAQVKAKS